jgi:SAM-dependent methyltransferase
MSGTTFEGTIDWGERWREITDGEREYSDPSERHLLDALREFLAERGPPESYADVGCGPGTATFDVADRYPDAAVVGYDAAEPVLDANRERAAEEGAENVRFEQAILPEFDPDRQFDVVSACYVLCYVEDTERALRTLYDAVAPGGDLVLTYHNRYARAVFRKIAESPHEHLDEGDAWDPEHFADRFELVLSGESLLSYGRIHDVLGAWPQSVWSVADGAERYRAWRHNPFVFVPK